MQAQYLGKDYSYGFRGNKEKLASSPSKVHVGHHIAAGEVPYLAETNALFVNTPFQYGFSLTRWQQSLHCMLQKKERPWIH